MKKIMNITIIRDFREAKGRFISIILMILISTFALVGLFHVGPTLRNTGDQYFDKYNMADVFITSTYGFAPEDMKVIESSIENEGMVEFGYVQDVTIKNTDTSFRIYSQGENISSYEVIDGQMPINKNQIAISNVYASQYPIGSSIEFSEKGTEKNQVLSLKTFEVVGHINSVEILSPSDLGPTKVGTGLLDGYAVATPDVFKSDTYMVARLTFDDMLDQNAFTDEYQSLLASHKIKLEKDIKDLPQVRIEAIRAEGNSKLDEQKAELNNSQDALDTAKASLDTFKIGLDNTKTQLDLSSEQIALAKSEISSAKAQIELELGKINESQSELDEEKLTLQAIWEEYYYIQSILDREYRLLEEAQAEHDELKAKREEENASSQEVIEALQSQIDSIDEALANEWVVGISKEELEEIKADLNSQLEQVKSENLSPEEVDQLLADGQTAIDMRKAELDAYQVTMDTRRENQIIFEQELAIKQTQLNQARNELILKRDELTLQEQNLNESSQNLDLGYNQYYLQLGDYTTKFHQYETESQKIQPKILEGKQKILEEREKLSKLSLPVYTISSRTQTSTSSGYILFTNLAISVDKVASIFPILLYIVAALVTHTNMSRYVEDQRTNSGTYLALGYSESTIKRRYVLYGFVSSGIGACLGIILGSTLVPQILYYSFRNDFTTPDLAHVFSFKIVLIALIVSVLSATIPTILVTSKEFRTSPSKLMIPKPPKHGATIFLERISFIWERLSFAQKVTVRNIVRNKKRMFMTIFGVSGSVALLFTGLAMQGSIRNMVGIQYQEILNYDMIVFEENDSSIEERLEVDKFLTNDKVEQSSGIYYEVVEAETENINEPLYITMIVGSNLENYVEFRERKSNTILELGDGEVIISEKLAKLLNVSVGDNYTFTAKDGMDVSLKVGGVMEMYSNHYIFMNEQTYKHQFNQPVVNNAHMVILDSASDEDIKNYAIQILKLHGVKSVGHNFNQISQIKKVSKSLNFIMEFLSFFSLLLVIVILYNITNINISERMYELSTTKVLGYLDREVTFYIYRETIILSTLGIFMGYIMGNIIHQYMINEVAPYNIMFNPHVIPSAYIYPTLLIITATFVLGIMLHIRLKSVDMLSSLQSNE